LASALKGIGPIFFRGTRQMPSRGTQGVENDG
jgi:hypothetical protein